MSDFDNFSLIIKNDPFDIEHHIYDKKNKFNILTKKIILKEIGVSVVTIKRIYGKLLVWIMNTIHTNKYSFGKKSLLYIDIKNKTLSIELENIKITMINENTTNIQYDYYFIIIVEIFEILVDYVKQIYGIIFPIFDEQINHKNKNVLNMITISDFIIDMHLNTHNYEYEKCKNYYFINKEIIKNINLLIFDFIKEELNRNVFYYYEQIFLSIDLSI